MISLRIPPLLRVGSLWCSLEVKKTKTTSPKDKTKTQTLSAVIIIPAYQMKPTVRRSVVSVHSLTFCSCMGWVWTHVLTHHKIWAPFLAITSELCQQRETRHTEKHGARNTLLSYSCCWFWFSDKVNWLSQGKFAPHLLWTEQAQPALINHSHQETGTNGSCSAGASGRSRWPWCYPRARLWDVQISLGEPHQNLSLCHFIFYP